MDSQQKQGSNSSFKMAAESCAAPVHTFKNEAHIYHPSNPITGQQIRVLDEKQIGALSEDEKIDLIEKVLAYFYCDAHDKEAALEIISNVTPITRSFLATLEKKILSRQIPARIDWETDELIYSTTEQTSPDFYDLKNLSEAHMRIKDVVIMSRHLNGRTLGSISNKNKALFMASLHLLGRDNEDPELGILAKSTRLDEASTWDSWGFTRETVYEALKREINAFHEKSYRDNLPRNIHLAAADFIKYLHVDKSDMHDDKMWISLCKILFDGLDRKAMENNEFSTATTNLFRLIPESQELKNIHEKIGVQIVSAALKNPELIKGLNDAEQNWTSDKWNSNLKNKKRIVKALYHLLGDAYSVKMPTVKFFKKRRIQNKKTDATTIAGYESSKKYANKNGKMKIKGRIRFNRLDGNGIKRELQVSFNTAFHEFCHLFEDVLLEKKKFGQKMTENPDALNRAVTLLKYSDAFYVDPDINRELYRDNPREKHARWFATHMMGYYAVLKAELLEQKNPGKAMEKSWPLVEEITSLASTYSKFANNEKTNISFDEIVRLGDNYRAAYTKDAIVSLEQLQDYQSIISKFGEVWSGRSSKTYQKMLEVIKEEKILDIWSAVFAELKESDFRIKYINFKRYEREQKTAEEIPAPQLQGRENYISRVVAPGPMS